MYIRYCRYGAHLSQEQVAELVAPHPDTLELVGSWLAIHEVPSASVSITHGGGWLSVYNVSIAQANALLGATYQRYQHIETNETIIRTIGYALPAALHMHVQTVAPTTYFGSPRALRLNSKVMSNGPTLPNGDHELQNASATSPLDAPLPSTCSVTITPECLRQLYNTLSYKPQAPSSNSLGVTGYLDQFASHSDLTEFLSLFRIDALSAQFPVVRVNGGLDDQNQPGVEVSPVLHVRVNVMSYIITQANLDIQYTESISYPTPNIFYSTKGTPPFKADDLSPTNTNEPYLDWLHFILEQNTIPQTISTSYGDDEQTVPPDYAESVCNLFAQLGSMGVSVLFASGDNGVGGGSCRSNDGTKSIKFIPVFPASCAFYVFSIIHSRNLLGDGHKVRTSRLLAVRLR